MTMGSPPALWTRRAAVAGLLAGLPGLSFAAPSTSLRPRPRPGTFKMPPPVLPGSLSDFIFTKNVAGHTGAVLVDMRSGAVIEAHEPGLKLPPASVAKAMTTLYALDTLGAKHRFSTRLIATGPVAQGRVQGDLYLVGGGDPHLDSDHLAGLVAQLVSRGIHGVKGNFYVVGTALPLQKRIDPEQPVYVGYNPSVSGMNLNFNRVFFEWEKKKGLYSTTLEARARKYSPAVNGIGMTIVDRKSPVFSYRSLEGRDEWGVAKAALGKKGGRWLPVRAPGDYAGEVFRIIAASKNVRLPEHRRAARAPAGTVVAAHSSIELHKILRSMLYYSTNLTAEAVGMSASLARGASFSTLEGSGKAMANWAVANTPVRAARFVDHSGLSDRSRIAPVEMVAALRSARGADTLRVLGKKYPVLDANGKPGKFQAIRVHAKSGTLNFARCLSGIIENSSGRTYGFAVFACNFDERKRYAGIERPPGSRGWRNRARKQEREMLRRWAGIVAG